MLPSPRAIVVSRSCYHHHCLKPLSSLLFIMVDPIVGYGRAKAPWQIPSWDGVGRRNHNKSRRRTMEGGGVIATWGFGFGLRHRRRVVHDANVGLWLPCVGGIGTRRGSEDEGEGRRATGKRRKLKLPKLIRRGCHFCTALEAGFRRKPIG
ncbi:hypothetical protein GUJ93_ZPchr0005g15333 [Zizania palustris]|uniref:Uncharacterized protein n=1 Tax=Zizania palustris TaxID=103762 RepID=A0A8J5SU46_ZIZPA|nr:hypothetical protein GUJ93_ZPchr0005g15333 [Zizania palustris]